MSTVAENVASHLLKIKAIKLEPAHPFTWASGWKSPIYCDNRKTLSYPGVRSYIKEQFAAVIREKYPQAEVIAGVATGAIAQGVLVAQELNLPFYLYPFFCQIPRSGKSDRGRIQSGTESSGY